MILGIHLWVIDFLVLFGTLIMTIAVIGSFRLPSLYTRQHASSMSFVMGMIPILLAVLFSGIPSLAFRALLIIGFYLLTSPISSHVVASAAYGNQVPLQAPGSLDESGRLDKAGEEDEPDENDED